MATAVPPPVFADTGLQIPAESDILAGVTADLQTAFGGALNPSPSTPQGQLAASMTAIIGDRNDKFLALANAMDPALNSGRWQDGIGRIYFIDRIAATATTVTATCTGRAGVLIPVGARAVDQGGLIYVSVGAVTIPETESVDVVFQCLAYGPNACPAGYLNRIYQAVPGWDTVSNAAAGVIGRNVETPLEFEYRRKNSVAHNGHGTPEAIRGAVFGVDDVSDVYVIDNPTNATVTIGGVDLVAHSVYVAVYGGLNAAIAQAIWSKKSGGCNYNGNTSVLVYDRSAADAAPYPRYTVTFQRPAPLPIKMAVFLRNNLDVPSTVVSQVRAAVQEAFAGLDGGPRARIGQEVFASRFYCGIAALGAWARILEIKIGTSDVTLDSVAVQIDQIPTLSDSDIAVSLVT